MLRQGNVKLIGEPFPQLALGANPDGPTGPGGAIGQPGPQSILAGQVLAANACFARIYGFSFEGHYYDLPRPVIMLVHGGGIPLPNQGAPAPPNTPTIDQTDEAARVWEFSGNLYQWNYDKKTMSIRLDFDSGTIEQILLERGLGVPGAHGAAVAGAGAHGAAVSGAGAYGAAVSGAAVSGAGAHGAGAFGAGAFGRGRRGWD
jgi:hypothetical protein